jgi:hypothetical protein
MNGLAELLAECEGHGIRLLPHSGGLTIDARPGALTRDLLDRLKASKAELMAQLRPSSQGVLPGGVWLPELRAKRQRATTPACRCGSTTWRDVPIHSGLSLRRDCGRCGRFIDFPIWHGNDALHNEQ